MSSMMGGRRLLLARTFAAMRQVDVGSPAIKNGHNQLHITAPRSLPMAAPLPLPDNIQNIDANEMGRFSPMRSRDISGAAMESHYGSPEVNSSAMIDVTVDSDPHMQSYDCRGAVNLSSSMQSNVPSPFGGQVSILSMPGSQWSQEYKYLSEHLHSSHYHQLRESYAEKYNQCANKNSGAVRSYHTAPLLLRNRLNGTKLTTGDKRTMSTNTPEDSKNDGKPLSRSQQLKQAVAAYGSTVIVFHIAISLASLGGFYLLVSSGLDVVAWIEYFGLADGAFAKKVTAGTGTFVIAYAVHKVFAPVRIGITLTATPFIVRHLRKIGILKTPQK